MGYAIAIAPYNWPHCQGTSRTVTVTKSPSQQKPPAHGARGCVVPSEAFHGPTVNYQRCSRQSQGPKCCEGGMPREERGLRTCSGRRFCCSAVASACCAGIWRRSGEAGLLPSPELEARMGEKVKQSGPVGSGDSASDSCVRNKGLPHHRSHREASLLTFQSPPTRTSDANQRPREHNMKSCPI